MAWLLSVGQPTTTNGSPPRLRDAAERGAVVGSCPPSSSSMGYLADAAASSGDAGIFDWCSAPPTKASMCAPTCSRLNPRDDVGLKIRDQLGRIRIAAIGAITQMLEQPLQQKQITDAEHLVLAGRRHVPGRARESCKDFARGKLSHRSRSSLNGGGRPWTRRARSVLHSRPSMKTLAGIEPSALPP